MATQHLLLAAAAIVLAVSSLHVASAETAAYETAYDILEKNNLPRGLLPRGVLSYVLSPDSQLEATLPTGPGGCVVLVSIAGKQYKFLYDGTVGGIVKPGYIDGVYGVRVQVGVALEWLVISQVVIAGGQLEFRIKAQDLSLSFPVSIFAHSPRCN